MKKIFFLFLILLFGRHVHAQTTGYIRNDTIKLTNAAKNTTLIIESASRGHNWYLKDIGNGRTQFVEATIADVSHLQDSLGKKANDTAVVHLAGDNSTGTQNLVGQKYNLTYTSPILHVHQGITFGGGYIWLITSDWIYKCDASYNRLDSVAYATNGNHMGGGKYDNGKLYVAFEQLSGATFSGQKILVFDATTAGIPLLTRYDVSAQNAEVSGLTVNVDTITTISFLDGRKVWKYNKNTGAFISTVSLSKYMFNMNGIGYYANKYYYFADNGIWTSDLSGNNFSLQNIGTDSSIPYNPAGVFESGDIVSGDIRLLIDPSNGGTNPGYGGVVTSYVKYYIPIGVSAAASISPSGDINAFGNLNLGETGSFPNIYSPFKYGTRNYLKWWIEDKNGAPPFALYHNDNVTAIVRNAWFDSPNNIWRYADSSKYAFRMGYNALGSYQFMIATPTNTSAALSWTNVMQIAPTAIYPGTGSTISLGFAGTPFLDLQLSGTGYAGNFASPLSTVRNQLVGSVYLSGITQGVGTVDYNSFDSQIYIRRRNDTTTFLAAKIARAATGLAIDVSTSTGLSTDVSLPHSLFLANDGRLGEGSQSPTTYHSFRPSDANYASFNIPVQTATPPAVNGSVNRPSTDQLTFKGTALMNFIFNDHSAMLALGSVPYASGTASHAELAPNTVATMKFFTQTGTGSAGQAPAWFNLFDTQNTWTQKQIVSRSNGVSVTDGWFLQNLVAATSSVIQVSPAIHYAGNGWNTGSSSSYTVDFRSYAKPNNTGTSGGKIIWDKSLDGVTFQQVASLDDTGLFTVKSLAISNLSTGTNGDTVLTIKNNQVNRTVISSGTGTVTSVATGYGLSGGSITSTGTLLADTTSSTGLVSKSRLSAALALKASSVNPYSTSAAPSIVADVIHAGAGYTLSISGTNQDGVITLITGPSPSGVGGFLTVTMSGSFAYPTTCVPVLQGANAITSGIVANITCPSSSTTSWDISTNIALIGSTTYKWNYHNGGY